MTVMIRDLPAAALLQRYAQDPKCYTDCLTKDVSGQVDLATFVTAFYTTRLFKAERFILGLFGRPGTDGTAADVAQGHTASFAAWTVEARDGQQLLMCDMGGKTRSWFMVAPEGAGTRLYFGSAVVNKDHWLAKGLMPFHQWYARALMRAVKL